MESIVLVAIIAVIFIVVGSWGYRKITQQKAKTKAEAAVAAAKGVGGNE